MGGLGGASSAACGAQGPNKFCDLVYLSAKHPDRIVTCDCGLENILLGGRGETG